jgi:heme/copper-type cytochrome/quinol oxidase subunit 2
MHIKIILFVLPLSLLIFFTGFPVFAEMEVSIEIREHRFHPEEIRVPAGTKLKLVVTNTDKTMEEFESHSLNREKMIRPGQTITIPIPALKPGKYEFFGEFNPTTARGWLIAE